MNHNDVEQISILVVEDAPDQRDLVISLIAQHGYDVLGADCVEAAIVILQQRPVDIVFSDWKLGQLSGLDLLNYVRKHHPNLGFVIATAYGSISHAVEAIQSGADDYLSKPFQRQELLLTLEKAYKSKQLKTTNQSLSQQLGEQQALIGLIGHAPCMQQVFARIQRISSTSASVLISGESGTGKELAARALYQLSDRHSEPFIAVNCGAIPESLAEAELFGAEKGAYTGATSTKIGKFEAAHGGTLFLDEVAELSLTIQTKLLRLLQEGTVTRIGSNKEIAVDVRIIAATHRHLPEQIKLGLFREDLFYRLNVVPIEMPSLRQRREDIPRLIEHFIELNQKRYKVKVKEISKQSLRKLIDHSWPGNVRELANCIERYVLLQDEQELLSVVDAPQTKQQDAIANFTLPSEGINWETFERQCLHDALEQCDGNKTKAAKFLQMSYKAFLYRLEKYNLT